MCWLSVGCRKLKQDWRKKKKMKKNDHSMTSFWVGISYVHYEEHDIYFLTWQHYTSTIYHHGSMPLQLISEPRVATFSNISDGDITHFLICDHQQTPSGCFAQKVILFRASKEVWIMYSVAIHPTTLQVQRHPYLSTHFAVSGTFCLGRSSPSFASREASAVFELWGWILVAL